MEFSLSPYLTRRAPKYWALCGSVIFWFIISRALWCFGVSLHLSLSPCVFLSSTLRFKFLVFLSFDSLDLFWVKPQLWTNFIFFIFLCLPYSLSFMYMWVRHDLNLLTCAICTRTYIYRLLWMKYLSELSEGNKNGVKWIAIQFHVHWRFLLNEWNFIIMWLWQQRQRQFVH